LQFTTKIPIQKCNFPIDYDSKILLLGSCFAENIGNKFQYFKFQSTTNPFGIIFNAVSLEKLIRRAVENRTFTENDIFFHNELWHCYEVHSELSHPDKEEFLSNLNSILETTKNQINSLSHCSITLGTSWVYRNNETNEIVANCHKVPQKHFTKELISISQTEESLQNIVSLVHSLSPNCHFILTVSPVRHIKDGFVENSLSKAHLVSSIFHALQVSSLGAEGVYFPSYEIMMDELRDYRFYDRDMLHPNSTAIDYIWERFVTSFTSEQAQVWMQEIDAIQKALLHRPFQPESDNHMKFRAKLEERIQGLRVKLPHVSF
jgi:hypothetical protein